MAGEPRRGPSQTGAGRLARSTHTVAQVTRPREMAGGGPLRRPRPRALSAPRRRHEATGEARLALRQAGHAPDNLAWRQARREESSERRVDVEGAASTSRSASPAAARGATPRSAPSRTTRRMPPAPPRASARRSAAPTRRRPTPPASGTLTASSSADVSTAATPSRRAETDRSASAAVARSAKPSHHRSRASGASALAASSAYAELARLSQGRCWTRPDFQSSTHAAESGGWRLVARASKTSQSCERIARRAEDEVLKSGQQARAHRLQSCGRGARCRLSDMRRLIGRVHHATTPLSSQC